MSEGPIARSEPISLDITSGKSDRRIEDQPVTATRPFLALRVVDSNSGFSPDTAVTLPGRADARVRAAPGKVTSVFAQTL